MQWHLFLVLLCLHFEVTDDVKHVVIFSFTNWLGNLFCKMSKSFPIFELVVCFSFKTSLYVPALCQTCVYFIPLCGLLFSIYLSIYLPAYLRGREHARSRARGAEGESLQADSPLSIEPTLGGLISNPWHCDLKWNQELGVQPTEPPRRHGILVSF